MDRLRRADEDKREAAAAKNELESYILATRARVRSSQRMCTNACDAESAERIIHLDLHLSVFAKQQCVSAMCTRDAGAA